MGDGDSRPIPYGTAAPTTLGGKGRALVGADWTARQHPTRSWLAPEDAPPPEEWVVTVPAYTIRVAINGSETDVDVENDAAEWVTKVANVRIADGGGSASKPTNQAGLTMDVHVPLNLAANIRTVTIAVQGPYGGVAPAWVTSAGGGEYYRVVFHGYVYSSQAKDVGDGLVQINAYSEMQGLMERRARTAQSLNSGPRDLCTDIETAHSITINNNTGVPTWTALDRPAQKDATNGAWLKTAMVGLGGWITAEWDGPITAPAMCWRTDYYWSSGKNNALIRGGRPWKYVYEDVGIAWQDFPARVEVDGGSTRIRHPFLDRGTATSTFYGYARLSDGAVRTALGAQTVSLQSWIDNATDCQVAANNILETSAEPTYLRIYRMGIPIELCYNDAVADAGFTEDPEDVFAEHAWLMVGDVFCSRAAVEVGGAFDDTATGFGDWPAECPVGSDRYDNLEALWQVELKNDVTTVGPVDYYTIRSVWREWNPAFGWYVQVGLEPFNLAAASLGLDQGNDTY